MRDLRVVAAFFRRRLRLWGEIGLFPSEKKSPFLFLLSGLDRPPFFPGLYSLSPFPLSSFSLRGRSIVDSEKVRRWKKGERGRGKNGVVVVKGGIHQIKKAKNCLLASGQSPST